MEMVITINTIVIVIVIVIIIIIIVIVIVIIIIIIIKTNGMVGWASFSTGRSARGGSLNKVGSAARLA